MPPPSDSDLIRRCRDGDEDAWRVLVERHGPLVHALGRAVASDADAADDLMLQTFARLLAQIDRLERPERVRSWLVTTVKRLALDARREQRRWVRLDGQLDGRIDQATGPLERLTELQERASVHAALAELDPRCRELLSLLYMDPQEPSYQAIAQRLGMAIGSIGPTRARCLEKLRRLHAGQDTSEGVRE